MPKRQYRRAVNDSDEDEEDEQCVSSTLADVRDLQKLRKRPAGLSIDELAHGNKPVESRESKTDPLNLKTGGMLDMRKLKTVDLKNPDIEEGIRQTFSKESHLRDEDEEMRKYVEDEVSRRKGRKQEAESDHDIASKIYDESLYELPDNLKQYQSKRTENMLSNQMLCGIPEVDLGIELSNWTKANCDPMLSAKIRNIEETEMAKLKLLKEAMDKKRSLTEKLTSRQNLAKDLAKGYVQHNIYNIQETTKIGAEIKTPIIRPHTQPVPVVAEDTPKWVQDGRTVERPADPMKHHRRPDSAKSTDKQMADKFKQKFVKQNKKK